MAFLCASLCGGCTASRGAGGPRSAELDGVRIVYENHGRGRDAVVFVHGWASDRSFWEKQVADRGVGAGRRLIALDLPGHGASDKPEALEYSMDYFARAVAAVMDDAGVERAVLVGHSNGTPVIRQFYRRYPRRVRGLVVVDGALRSFFDDPAQAERFIAPLRGPDYLVYAERFAGSMLGAVHDEADREHIRRVMLATPRHVMVGALEGAMDPAIWTDDPIEAPTLVVLAESPFWDEAYGAHVRRLVPRVEYHVMPGVSHFLMMDEPEEFNALLVGFLERVGM